MGIVYRIYGNDGQGGAVDYRTPAATVDASAFQGPVRSYLAGPLQAPGDYRFGVRAFDSTSGIEEANTDAVVRVVIDDQGRDVSARPNAVAGLSARWASDGSAVVTWGYDPAGQGGPPTRFALTVRSDGDDPQAAPGVGPSVDYLAGRMGYLVRVPGLAAAGTWTIEVSAIGGFDGLSGPSRSASVVRRVDPLLGVDSLTARATA